MLQILEDTHRLSLVWVGLVLVTLLSLGSAQSEAAMGIVSRGIIFVVSFIKADLILMYFLELRHSSQAWRVGFRAFLLVLIILLFGLGQV